MEIDEIVDYATKSPENTNPAVLRSMLSQLNGSGGSALIVEVTEVEERWICNKTWQEIYDAFMSGVVRLNFPVSKENAAKIGTVIGIDVEYAYGIIYTFGTSSDQMSATTANDYPSISFD